MEVSLSVQAELAESVADVLARWAPRGVVLHSEPNPDPDRVGSPQPTVRVAAYLSLDESWPGTREQIERGLWHLGQIRRLPDPAFREVEDEDWAEAWKAHYRPLPIGRRLLIQPSWIPDPETDRHLLRMDPGQAFGTGTHPSTQLCLELIEDHLQPGQRMVDLGCGSGILSVAALRLGASSVLALDLDDLAIRATLENAERNDVAGRIDVVQGSFQDIARTAWGARSYDLLVANILFGVLDELLRLGLGRAGAPGCKTILAGVLVEQGPAFEAGIAAAGLEIVERRERAGWAAWVVKQTAPYGAV